MASMSDSDLSSEPLAPPDSPGSSVSSRLQEEYEELLKYAVVVPSYDPQQASMTLSRQTFPRAHPNGDVQQQPQQEGEEEQEQEDAGEETDRTVTEDGESTMNESGQTLEGDEEEDVRSRASSLASSTRRHQPRRAAPSTQRELQHSTPIEHTPEGPPRTAPAIHRGESDGILASGGRLFDGDTDSEDGRDFRHSLRVQQDVEYSSGVDTDISRFELLLDGWTLDLKRNVLDEFSKSRIKSIETHRTVLMKEKEKHGATVRQLQDEIESMKELLHTYEQSIARKDQVIHNLTTGLQKQKEKFELARTFNEWKLQHNDSQREEFASNLASKHYHHTLTRKCYDGWHKLVENKWRQRVEKACQSKASEVCMTLTNDYEARIASLNEALESSREEVCRLHGERDKYEETMKKAFMRGVCALNLEAMNMFHEQEGGDGVPAPGGAPEGRGEDDDEYAGDRYGGFSVGQEAVYNSEPPGAPPPRIVSSSKVTSQTQAKTAGSRVGGRGGKVLTAKVTARTDSGLRSSSSRTGGTLAPPMSSVVVERHQAVNKETIGQATASHYPKQPVIVNRRIAGQGPGNIPLVTPNIQNIKVVE